MIQLVSSIGQKLSRHSTPEICSICNAIETGDIVPEVKDGLIEILSEADKIHTLSRDIAKEAERLVPNARNKFAVIENAVFNKTIQMYAYQAVDHLWLNDKRLGTQSKVILTIGRHWAQRNYFSLIEAYAQVRTHRQDVRLIILGKCPLKEGAELLAKRLNLEEVLSMLGWVAIPYANISRADLFVLS